MTFRLFNKVKSLRDSMSRSVRMVSFTLILLAGLVIIIGAVAFGLQTPTKFLAVIVASAGCCAGSSIVSLAMPKLAGLRLDEEREEIINDARERIELENKALQFTQSQKENEKLKAEFEVEKAKAETLIREKEEQIESLKNSRMKFEASNSSFKLEVLEFSLARTDHQKKDLDSIVLDRIEHKSSDETETIKRSTKVEYVGVVEHKALVQCKVDINRLKFCDRTPSVLEISGLETAISFTPASKEKPVVKLAEIRSLKINDDGNDFRASAGNILDGRCLGEHAKTKEYRKYLDEQVEGFWEHVECGGFEIAQFRDEGINAVKERLRQMLLPLNKQLEFNNEINDEGHEYHTYIENNNRQIEEQIKVLEGERSKIITLFDFKRKTAS